MERPDGHPAHPRLPRHPTSERPLPRRRPRCRARQFPAPSRRRCPTSKIYYAVKANPAPEILRLLAAHGLVLRHRFGRRDRDGAGCRRAGGAASPSATRSRRSATSRAPTSSASACLPSTASRRSRRSRVPLPARRVFCRVLTDGEGAEWPLSRKFGCVPAMAVDVLRHAQAARPRRLWRVVPCRLAADRPVAPGIARWPTPSRCSRTLAEEGIVLKMVNMGGGFPTTLPEGRAGGAGLWPGDLRGADASISATTSRRRSSSRAAAWSAMPASSSRKSC